MGPIGRHVPNLRRFARALTGSRRIGDDAVSAALRAVVDGRLAFDRDLPAQIALYKAFFDAWVGLPSADGGTVADPAGEDAGLLSVDRYLQSLLPADRAAFLLSAMDGFDVTEIAAILGRGAPDVLQLIERAETSLTLQLSARVLLVLPDFRLADDLKASIRAMGHRVVGQANRIDTIAAMADILRPGLIIATESGPSAVLSVLGRISERCGIPVVFISPHPERLLTGAPDEPAFLIPSPVDDQSLKAVIAQALFFQDSIKT